MNKLELSPIAPPNNMNHTLDFDCESYFVQTKNMSLDMPSIGSNSD